MSHEELIDQSSELTRHASHAPASSIPLHVRSFHARHGRLSDTRRQAIDDFLATYDLSQFPAPIDLSTAFTSDHVIVDFGCGMGENTRQLARNRRGSGILAIDVHTAGISDLLIDINEHAWSHVRVHFGDGYELFRDSLANSSIDEIQVLFPDPWPKARHNKRRLIQTEFLDICHRLLKPGGEIRLISDWPDYIVHADEVISEHKGFEQIEDNDEIPMTGYHAKAIREGRTAQVRRLRRL